MKKRIFALLLALAMVATMVACAAPESSSTVPGVTPPASDGDKTTPAVSGDQFLMGTYLQLTGSNSVAGNNAKNGIDLAAKYINENGGYNGTNIAIKHYDTTGSTEEAVKVVQKMLANDNVNAVIGSVNSNEVSACISYLNEAEVYNFGLGTSATWMANTDMSWTFRASANNNRIAPLDVDLIKEMGYDSVAIINGTDDTGSSTADAFEAACKEKGVTVTTRQQCDSEDTDFSGQISQILATDPDTIFMSLIGTTFGPFVKQLRNMGYTGMIGCKECFSLDYQQVAGGVPNTDYIYYVYPYVPYTSIDECNIPIMSDFLKLYEAEYNELPTHESAYRGWDTMMAMWEASKIAKSNEPTALRDATHKVKIDGLGGTLDYTAGDREGYSAFNKFILIDGKNVLIDEWLAGGGYDSYMEATGSEQ